MNHVWICIIERNYSINNEKVNILKTAEELISFAKQFELLRIHNSNTIDQIIYSIATNSLSHMEKLYLFIWKNRF